MRGGEDVFRVGRKLDVLAVEVKPDYYFLVFDWSRCVDKDAPREISYQMASWPSARVLRHWPDGRLHMRLWDSFREADDERCFL